VRQGFIEERTATINRIRGLLAEFGVVLPTSDSCGAQLLAEARNVQKEDRRCSGRCAVVIVEHATETLVPVYWLRWHDDRVRPQELVCEALMIAFSMGLREGIPWTGPMTKRTVRARDGASEWPDNSVAGRRNAQ
jgi:hypothetical protein